MSLSSNLVTNNSMVTLMGQDPQALFTSNGSFTVPTGLQQIFVAVVGGGGGGANGGTTWSSGGGGGGACMVGWMKVKPGQIIPANAITFPNVVCPPGFPSADEPCLPA